MFCVHIAGDDLGAVSHDFGQNGFAALVNECHVNEVYDASAPVAFAVLLSPG